MSIFQKSQKKESSKLKKENLGFKLFLENTKNIFKSPLTIAKNFFNLLSTQKKNASNSSTQKEDQQNKPSFLGKTLSPIKENALNFLKSSFNSANSLFNNLKNDFKNPVSEGPEKKLAQKSEQSTPPISEEALNKMKNKYPFNYQLFACMNFALSALQRANKNLSDETQSTLLQYKNSILNSANSIPTDRDISSDDVQKSLEIIGDIALSLNKQVDSESDQSKTILTNMQQIIVQQALPTLNYLQSELKAYIKEKEEKKSKSNKNEESTNKNKTTSENANETQSENANETKTKNTPEDIPTVTLSEIEGDNKKISELKENFSGNYNVYTILQFTISSFRVNRLLSSEIKEKVDSYKEIIENTARSIPINKAIDRNTVGTYVEILGDIASSIESQINQTSSDQDISILKSIQNIILEQAIPLLNVALDDTDNLEDEDKEKKDDENKDKDGLDDEIQDKDEIDDENKIKNTKEKKALDHLRKIKSKNKITPKTKKGMLKDELKNILYYTKSSLSLAARFGTASTKERLKKESKKITQEIKKFYYISEQDFSLGDITPSKDVVKDIAKKHYSGNQKAMSYLKKIISNEVLPQIENIEAKMDEEELNTNQSN